MTNDLWKRVCATVTPLDKAPKKKITKPAKPRIRTIDLHGMTVQDAYDLMHNVLPDWKQKTLIIITGKSGRIFREFPTWMANFPNVSGYILLPSGGAYQLTFQKKT